MPAAAKRRAKQAKVRKASDQESRPSVEGGQGEADPSHAEPPADIMCRLFVTPLKVARYEVYIYMLHIYIYIYIVCII